MAKQKQHSFLGRIGGAALFAIGMPLYALGEAIGWFNREGLSMWREAVNDIRQTFNEVMWGKPEHAQGQGVPLNPTGIMVTQDLGRSSFRPDMAKTHGFGTAMSMAEFSKEVDQKEKRGQGQQRERGHEETEM